MCDFIWFLLDYFCGRSVSNSVHLSQPGWRPLDYLYSLVGSEIHRETMCIQVKPAQLGPNDIMPVVMMSRPILHLIMTQPG